MSGEGRSSTLDQGRLFGTDKPIVGMVHLLALPGAPGWGGSMRAVVDRASRDLGALAEGGVDGFMVENYGDAPFSPGRVGAETIAALTHVVGRLIEQTELPCGVNVLRNDARSALAIAAATGAGFIRVNVHTGAMLTDQGWIQGRADKTLRLRSALGTRTVILADVHVKHATAPPGVSLEQAARDTWFRGRADGLIVSGPSTGAPTAPDHVRRIKRAVPLAPVWVGSGVTEENAAEILELADGAIVGSAFQNEGEAGSPVSSERVRALVSATGRRRGALTER